MSDNRWISGVIGLRLRTTSYTSSIMKCCDGKYIDTGWVRACVCDVFAIYDNNISPSLLTLCLPKTEISVFQRPTLACQRRRFPSLWRNVCFSHPHVTNYICLHYMMCYTVRKKKCSSLFWYTAIIVWFSQFIMTVVQNQATLNEKRRPGTGSSPKTAGSQSVNDNN